MRKLMQLKKLSLIASAVIFFNAVGLIIIGIYKSILGYKHLLESVSSEGWAMPGVVLAESTDSILLGLVFFILSACIYKIFFMPETESAQLPKWLDVSNIKELKVMVWEALLLTMVMIYATHFFSKIHQDHQMSWESLVMPVSILLLAVGLRMIK